MFVLWLKMAFACEDLASVPDALQVAWVSPVRAQVRYKQQVNVVRYSELQKYVANEKPTTTELLQHLGIKRGRIRRDIDPQRYKLVIFDVTAQSMCRPILTDANDDRAVGTVGGLTVCKQTRRTGFVHRSGDSGCGYLIDTKTDERTFDLYRVSWADASAQGFCVLPLARFLNL